MKKSDWNKSNAKKLFDCFMDIEENQYPKKFLLELKRRRDLVENLILKHGCNRVSITNYTNLGVWSSSISLDVFQSGKWQNGDIDIHIGSEPHEMFATRIRGKIREKFNFKTLRWSKYV